MACEITTVVDGMRRLLGGTGVHRRSCRSTSRLDCRSCRRRHEFRSDRIRDPLPQPAIDLRFGGGVELPSVNAFDGRELIRPARSPQRRRYPLIEHPAHREWDETPAETVLRQEDEASRHVELLAA